MFKTHWPRRQTHCLYKYAHIMDCGGKASSSETALTNYDSQNHLKQESIPVGCVQPACTDRNSFNGQMSSSGVPSSHVLGAGPVEGGPQVSCVVPGQWGSVYSEVQCIMGNGHMGTPPWTHTHKHTCENITFPQLRWRAVTRGLCKQIVLKLSLPLQKHRLNILDQDLQSFH